MINSIIIISADSRVCDRTSLLASGTSPSSRRDLNGACSSVSSRLKHLKRTRRSGANGIIYLLRLVCANDEDHVFASSVEEYKKHIEDEVGGRAQRKCIITDEQRESEAKAE